MKLKGFGKPEGTKKVKLYNCDNLELMKQYEDNYFDLAVLDPPYGIGTTNDAMGGRKVNKKAKAKGKTWDNQPPGDEYFDEVKRICKGYIVWGANYFPQMWPARNVIVWDKEMRGMDFADCEIAATNLKDSARIYTRNAVEKNRIHVNQKPVELYSWLLNKYAEKKFRVLDLNLGSGSSAIAAHYFGVKEFVGCELDAEYYAEMVERFKKVTAQKGLIPGFGV